MVCWGDVGDGGWQPVVAVAVAVPMVGMSWKSWNFDQSGNLSFGIADYTDFPEQKYDPDIGIFGMDINIVLERPGHRVSRRRRRAAKVGVPHRVGKTESMEWFKEHFGLTLVEE